MTPDPLAQARALAAEAERIYKGFWLESLNGVVCSIPDEGIDTKPHRTWCARCQQRYRDLKALADNLTSLAAAPPPTEAMSEDKAKRKAVANCYMMAKREIARIRNGKAQFDATGLQRWEAVLRFCEESGEKSSILRDGLPTEITDGSEPAPAQATSGWREIDADGPAGVGGQVWVAYPNPDHPKGWSLRVQFTPIQQEMGPEPKFWKPVEDPGYPAPFGQTPQETKE